MSAELFRGATGGAGGVIGVDTALGGECLVGVKVIECLAMWSCYQMLWHKASQMIKRYVVVSL